MAAISKQTLASWAALVLAGAGCGEDSTDPPMECAGKVDGGCAVAGVAEMSPVARPPESSDRAQQEQMAANQLQPGEAQGAPEPEPVVDEPAVGAPARPLYAMMVQVISEDGEDRTVYAVLSETLDLTDVSLATAREFRGVANFVALGGRLLVSSGEQPRVDSFEITPELTWTEGPSISFANYPLAEDGANIFYQSFVDEHTAYLPFDVSKRIVWDPTSMTITGTRETSSLELTRDNLTLEIGGNRTGVRYAGAVMQPFFYHDEDWFEFAPTSPIAVYDASHEEARVIEAPCAGLAVATRDEAGNTYFSSWDYSPGEALFGLAPAPCAVRVTAALQLDSEWTTDFADLTAGRLSINFRYVGGGKGLAQVLHQEEIELDFSGEYDPAVEDEIWGGTHWRPWLFDLEQRSGAPLQGIEAGSSGFQLMPVDGRNFVFVTYDVGGRTIAYELSADGTLQERFRTPGEVFKWIRVR